MDSAQQTSAKHTSHDDTSPSQPQAIGPLPPPPPPNPPAPPTPPTPPNPALPLTPPAPPTGGGPSQSQTRETHLSGPSHSPLVSQTVPVTVQKPAPAHTSSGQCESSPHRVSPRLQLPTQKPP